MLRTDHVVAVLGSGLMAVAGWPGLAPVEAQVLDPIWVAQALQTVRIGSLQTYSQPGDLVSAAFPSNWDFTDLSDPDLLRYVSIEPFQNAMFVVAAFESSTEFSPNQLAVLLQDDVESVFGRFPDFDMSRDATPQNDGSLRVTFGFLDETAPERLDEFMGNAFIKQQHGVIMLLYFMVPDDQFDRLRPDINGVINAAQINPNFTPSQGGGTDSVPTSWQDRLQHNQD